MKEKEIAKIKHLYEKKNYIKAEILCKRILKKELNFQVIYLLAHINFSRGRYETALKYIDVFLKSENNFDGLLTKVYCLMKLKRYDHAINILQKFRKEKDPEVLTLLAENYFGNKDYNKSEENYLKAYNISKNKSKLINLFNFYIKLKKTKSALRILLESNFAYNDFDIMLKIAKQYALSQDFKKSNLFLNQIISLFPNKFDIYHKIGINFSIMGKSKKALHYFNKSTSFNNAFGISHYQASKINNTIKKNQLDSLIEVYKNYKEIDENYIFLGLAISNYLEEKKQYPRSFYYLKRSNNIFKEKFLKGWNIGNEFLFFDRIKKVFDIFQRTNSICCSSRITPVFILGLPRSGTTLIEQILSCHSKVNAHGELPHIHNFFVKNVNYLFNREETLPDEKKIKLIARELKKSYDSKFSLNKLIITDKAPLNFMYMGFLKKIFSNSKIILCSRNKNDNILSIYQTFFANLNYKFSYNLEDLQQYYNLYEQLLIFWKNHQINFYELKYENIVSNNTFYIKNLLEYLNLKYEKGLEQFYLNNRPILTASYHQVRKPIYNTSIDKWKHYEEEINFFRN